MKIDEVIKELMLSLEKDYGWKFTEEEYANTPERVLKMYDEFKEKSDYSKFTVFENVEHYDELISMRGITYYSFCSHHLLPFFGEANIAYLPDKKIIGASKLARIVEKFAVKAGTQENLTQEIATELYNILEPRALIVILSGKHLCMLMRGVEQTNSDMITSAIKGDFYNNASLKREALSMLGMA